MAVVILKTVLATLDVIICLMILYGVKGDVKNRPIGAGAVIITALNIAAMWL